jgi:hypothetical protein
MKKLMEMSGLKDPGDARARTLGETQSQSVSEDKEKGSFTSFAGNCIPVVQLVLSYFPGWVVPTLLFLIVLFKQSVSNQLTIATYKIRKSS